MSTAIAIVRILTDYIDDHRKVAISLVTVMVVISLYVGMVVNTYKDVPVRINAIELQIGEIKMNMSEYKTIHTDIAEIRQDVRLLTQYVMANGNKKTKEQH